VSNRETLLAVDDLRVQFWTSRGTVYAVNGISFEIAPGETLGIVGESGCGKSVTSLALLGLLPRTGRTPTGTAMFGDRDLLRLRDRELRKVRGRQISMIFQDPMTSLNPVLTIGRQIREALETHFDMKRRAATARAAELLDRVGIPSPEARLADYPHQFSGGMRQRAMIAMALACRPKLLIADEPTTALDVTIQAQILALLRELVAEEHTALILITHDLGVVAGMCERVNVMYAGMFVETGSAEQLFGAPRHPYTLGLLQSVSRLDATRRARLQPIEGSPRNMLCLLYTLTLPTTERV
jgi:ABC-type dipeptide/oligopeptide/nickel transport system ATPase component